MTALLTKPGEGNLWGTMPGWGIAADLTPPELVAARRLKVLQKFIAAALAIVVLACIGLYTMAYLSKSSATSALDAANAKTSQLTAQQAKYTKVTLIQTQTKAIDAQISSLMSSDVDVSGLVGKLRKALPGTMSITSVSVTLTGSSAVAGAAGPSLDTSGLPQIGAITLTGVAQNLDNLADYVSALSALPGVVNVIPTSNVSNPRSATWNVTMQLDNKLYSHRYDKIAGTN